MFMIPIDINRKLSQASSRARGAENRRIISAVVSPTGDTKQPKTLNQSRQVNSVV